MKRILAAVMGCMLALTPMLSIAAADNSVQIQKWGTSKPAGWYTAGEGYNDSNLTLNNDGVAISKTIAPTDRENYFDITLKVATEYIYEELIRTPSTDVVIVLDISNTMDARIGGKSSELKRIEAAKNAAVSFVNAYYDQNNGFQFDDQHRLGFVTFNTNANTVFGLDSILSKNQMIDRIKGIKLIDKNNKDEYRNNRYTNIEAGLQLAQNLLNGSAADHKYIVFLSDGFPTTYSKKHTDTSKSGIEGYPPYTSIGTGVQDGIFADRMVNREVDSGTSYSDPGARYAQKRAEEIKADGINIFSIGIDIGGQTIWNYVWHSGNYYPVVDRYADNYYDKNGDGKYEIPYVIGEPVVKRPASSTPSQEESSAYAGKYRSWLRDKIAGGPDYDEGLYADGNSSEALKNAFDRILTEIIEINKREIVDGWAVSDPMNTYIEFDHFYRKNGSVDANGMTGKNAAGAENTVSIRADKSIDWKIFNSGYRKAKVDDKEVYIYELTYRVRLTNEAEGFAGKENTALNTNGTTVLRYKVSNNGTLSSEKTMQFDSPEVEGYLVDVSFPKKDAEDAAIYVDGAVFTLTHDAHDCIVCKGDAKIGDRNHKFTAVSQNGQVTFKNVPSGHTYVLEEIEAPLGYEINMTPVVVKVDYDQLNEEFKDIEQEGIENQPRFWPTQRALTAKKNVSGAYSSAAMQEYVFELYASDINGNVVGNALQTKKADENGAVTFDAISYEKPGTHYYLIREMHGDSAFIDYDIEHEYLIRNTIARDGVTQTKPSDSPVFEEYVESGAYALKSIVSIQVREQDGEWAAFDGNQPTFENVDYLRTGFDFTKTSSFNGRKLEGAEFKLAHDADCACGYDSAAIPDIVVSSDKYGSVVFGKQLETEILAGPNGHLYQLRETKAPAGFELMNGVTYTVTVSAEGEVSIKRNENVAEDLLETSGIFENRAEYLPVKARIEARKLYDDETDFKGCESFVFALFDQEITANTFGYLYMPTTMQTVESTPGFVETVSNNDKGVIRFSEMVFDKAGTYEYWILEVPGVRKNVVYDRTVYKVSITVDEIVSEDGSGIPVVEFAYEASENDVKTDGVYTDEKPTFLNYEIPETGDNSRPILWMAMLAGALCAMCILMRRKAN